MTGGQRNILPLVRVSGIRCARGQKTITVADLRRGNTRPKQQLNHASKRRSNRLRTIGLRLLSKCNGWSTAVRNAAVPRQKNLNRPPRNCGRRSGSSIRTGLTPARVVRPCGLWGWATEPAPVAATRRRASARSQAKSWSTALVQKRQLRVVNQCHARLSHRPRHGRYDGHRHRKNHPDGSWFRCHVPLLAPVGTRSWYRS